jgi:hypothetical protein
MPEVCVLMKGLDEKIQAFNDRLKAACLEVPSDVVGFSVAGDLPFFSLQALEPEEGETEEDLPALAKGVFVLRLITDESQGQVESLDRLEALLDQLGDRVVSVQTANGRMKVFAAVVYYLNEAEADADDADDDLEDEPTDAVPAEEEK